MSACLQWRKNPSRFSSGSNVTPNMRLAPADGRSSSAPRQLPKIEMTQESFTADPGAGVPFLFCRPFHVHDSISKLRRNFPQSPSVSQNQVENLLSQPGEPAEISSSRKSRSERMVSLQVFVCAEHSPKRETASDIPDNRGQKSRCDAADHAMSGAIGMPPGCSGKCLNGKVLIGVASLGVRCSASGPGA